MLRTYYNAYNMQKIGRNRDGYCGETIDIEKVISDCCDSARSMCMSIENIPITEDSHIWFIKRVVENKRKRVYISAGIHGDEPAGPLAVLRLLSEGGIPHDIELVIFPCLNPTGFKTNTRENCEGIDLNRDYYRCVSKEIRAHIGWLESSGEFDLALCLHEDWEAHGFYLYESIHSEEQSISEGIINEVSKMFPIDKSAIIDGHTANGGVIGVPLSHGTPTCWPEAVYLFEKLKTPNYTFETSSDFPLELRVRAMCRAIKTALESI